MNEAGVTSTRPSSGDRAGDLTTKREIVRLFARRGSPRVLAAAVVLLASVRLVVGGFGRGDLIAVAVTIAITGTVEWIIHKYLLHAPEDAWTTRKLGTSTGHRQHHLDPNDVDWLLLRGSDAAVFVTAFGAVTAGWSLPLLALTRSARLGPFLTAWTCAAIGLLHYEWVHLLVHTRHRPRNRYYAALRRNHRLHHYRNEHYWLGVTSNTGDRIFHTLPADKSDVPLSPTARTLGADTDTEA